jgi:DNA-binding NtrC family response regulator
MSLEFKKVLDPSNWRRTVPNILIVDDHPCVRALLSEELCDEGYRVTAVGNVDFVFDQIETSPPDMVILDIYLNGFEAWDLLHKIKRKMPKGPVIIFTTCDSFRQDPRLVEADGFLIKSLSGLDVLKQKIRHHLEGRRTPEHEARRDPLKYAAQAL